MLTFWETCSSIEFVVAHFTGQNLCDYLVFREIEVSRCCHCLVSSKSNLLIDFNECSRQQEEKKLESELGFA